MSEAVPADRNERIAGGPAPAGTPSFMAGAARIFDLSLGELIWSRRTIFLALIVGSPVLLALVARIVQASGIAPLRVNGVNVDPAAMFGMITKPAIITIAVIR